MTDSARIAPDALERDLSLLFEVDPPPGLGELVRARLASAVPVPVTSRRPANRSIRRPLLVAALLSIAGACAVAVDRLDPFGHTGWVEVGRGTPLDLTAEASGWRLSLVQAYADANQLTLFMHADAPPGALGSAFAVLRDITITDEEGRVFPVGGSGHSAPVDGRSTHEISFEPPSMTIETGERRLSMRVERLTFEEPDLEPIMGPWTFEFEVEAQGGTLLEPGTRDEHDGVAITLDRLSVSPSMIRATLTIEGAPPGVDWVPRLLVRKGPKQWEGFGYGTWDAEGTGTMVIGAGDGGLDDAAGDWSVTVDGLRQYEYDSAGDDQIVQELVGPWDLSFEAAGP